jgi:bifunctional non-homologous end joining protein LigD
MTNQTLELDAPASEAPLTVNLYSNHNGANKVYHVYLVKAEGGWLVNFAHAGVGKPLKTGSKTARPEPYDKALKKFNALVKEKKNGDSHYVEGAPGTAYQQTVDSKALFGYFVQEPSPINYQQLLALTGDPAWGFQIKANGENRLLRYTDAETEMQGGNKKGQLAPVPLHWKSPADAVGRSFVANGEHVGDDFHAFDLLELDGKDIRGLPQSQRLLRLAVLTNSLQSPSFKLIDCLYDTRGKRELIEFAQSNNLEGIVAKRCGAPYSEGKGPHSLKFVFREVATCIVTGHNDKRSVQVALLNEAGELVPRGSVTIPANRDLPPLNSLVDVQYMYDNGNSFEIPVYDPNGVSPRSDVERDACTLKQVTRHKPSDQFVPFTATTELAT